MSLPRYPEYKGSRVRWLGEVPSHWTICRYKTVFRERAERSIDGSETLLSVSAYTGVSRRSEIIDEGDHLSRAESLEGYKVCYPGDLVMNIMLAWNRGLGFAGEHGIVSPAYSVFEVVADADARFLDYLVRSDSSIWYYKAFSAGVIDSRLRLYPDTFGSLYCALPVVEEQRVIATFLDRETAKIDALIAEQEKLLALLAEKRQATISHAVTRGLNPNVPMKDSGIPWLGEVPAHWEVGPLKRFWSVTDCKHLTAEFTEEGIPLASIREVQSRFVDLSDAKRTTEGFFEQLIEGGRDPRAGDLLFSRNATVGEVAQVPSSVEKFAMGQDVCLLRRLDGAASPDYMQCVLRSPVVAEQLNALMIGSTFKRINVEQIRSLAVPFPPGGEQLEISSHLEELLGSYESLAREAVAAVALLKERRNALISAAVTGKIDVRETA